MRQGRAGQGRAGQGRTYPKVHVFQAPPNDQFLGRSHVRGGRFPALGHQGVVGEEGVFQAGEGGGVFLVELLGARAGAGRADGEVKALRGTGPSEREEGM